MQYSDLERQVDAQSDAIWDMARKVWEFAELGLEESGRQKELANILTEQDNTVIFCHFLLQGQIEGLNHCHFSHYFPPPSSVRPP